MPFGPVQCKLQKLLAHSRKSIYPVDGTLFQPCSNKLNNSEVNSEVSVALLHRTGGCVHHVTIFGTFFVHVEVVLNGLKFGYKL